MTIDTQTMHASTNPRSEFGSFYRQIQNQPTFMLLGVQGSGTNFLSRILRIALDVSVTVDRSLIFNAAANLSRDRSKQRATLEANRIVDSLFPGPVRKRLLPKRYYVQNKNYVGIREHLSNAYTDSPSEFADFFYSYHAFVNSKSHKALKSDDVWENIDLAREILPNYRVLLLIRDPRDNALSIMSKRFGPCEIYHASCYVRKRMNAYVALADKNPDCALCVKYEDLLANPIDCVKRMGSFIGVEFTPEVQNRVEQLNIKRDNHQKWKRLSAYDLATSETVLADILSRFEYERGTDQVWSPSRLELVKKIIKDSLLRVPQKLAVKKRRYVRG